MRDLLIFLLSLLDYCSNNVATLVIYDNSLKSQQTFLKIISKLATSGKLNSCRFQLLGSNSIQSVLPLFKIHLIKAVTHLK